MFWSDEWGLRLVRLVCELLRLVGIKNERDDPIKDRPFLPKQLRMGVTEFEREGRA